MDRCDVNQTNPSVPREAVERLLAIGLGADEGHSMFQHNGRMEPAPNTVRMAREMLAEVANEGYRAAEDMSADVSRMFAKAAGFRMALSALCVAVRRDPAWHPLGCSGALFTALGVAEKLLADTDDDELTMNGAELDVFMRAWGFEP